MALDLCSVELPPTAVRSNYLSLASDWRTAGSPHHGTNGYLRQDPAATTATTAQCNRNGKRLVRSCAPYSPCREEQTGSRSLRVSARRARAVGLLVVLVMVAEVEAGYQ